MNVVTEKKPYVKLFKTPNGYYCFDVNRSEMVELEKDTFEYLQQSFSGEEDMKEPSTEWENMRSEGYFSEESNVKQVKHVLTDYVDDFLKRRITKLTLQVTQDCNFRCKYCIYSEEKNRRQRTHSAKNMSWDMAKKAVDFLWERSVDSNRVNIGFYGGEPLLQMELIKRVVDYSEKMFVGKELSFNITTNGTLLNEELVRYFAEHDISLMISLDGPKEINDKNRVFKNGTGTYDTVMKKIEMVRSTAPEYAKKMQISMVVDPENDFDCINSIYIEEADLDELFIAATIVDKEYDGETTKISETYGWKQTYQCFLALLSCIGRCEKKNVSPVVYLSTLADVKNRFDIDSYARLTEQDAPGGPCMPGALRLFCNVDGDLFPCERVSETSAVTCIGSLKDGLNIEKVEKFLNVGAVTGDVCRHCWSFRFCTLCGKSADSGTNQLDASTKLKFCAGVQNRAYDKIMKYLLFRELPVYYTTQISE